MKLNHLAATKFVKELLHTPIKDIVRLYSMKSLAKQQPILFCDGRCSSFYTFPPKVIKKNVVFLDLHYSSNIFKICAEYCGRVFKIGGTRDLGISYIVIYRDLVQFPGGIYAWKIAEHFDENYLKKNQGKTLLELKLPPFRHGT